MMRPPVLSLFSILWGQRLDCHESHSLIIIAGCLSGILQWKPLRFVHSQGPICTWYMLRVGGDDGGDPGPG